MNYRYRLFLVLSMGVLALCAALNNASSVQPRYWLVDIDRLGFDRVESIKHDRMVQWWIEAGDQLLVYGTPVRAQKAGLKLVELPVTPVPERLFLVKRAHDSDLTSLKSEVLVDAGRSAIIQTKTSGTPEFAAHKHSSDADRSDWSHAIVRIFEPNLVLMRQVANDPTSKHARMSWRDGVSGMVDEVNGERWFADVEHLASLNRFTHGPGVIAARDWFKEQFSALPHTEVSMLEFKVGASKAYNVVAKMTGTERPDEWFIVGGHYDSISQSTSTAAPGAEDNGTGSAGVLEMARLFAEHPPKSTVYFMVYAGEEQGLDGSEAHVKELVAASDTQKVKAVINMDMIGYSRTSESLNVLLETEPVATSLMETLKAAAATYTTMGVSTTFDAWGSDHVPYLQKQIPAVLTIDKDWSRYPDYHRTTDLPSRVVKGMGVEILKMNTATLAELAGI